jgi:hypothetical protein
VGVGRYTRAYAICPMAAGGREEQTTGLFRKVAQRGDRPTLLDRREGVLVRERHTPWPVRERSSAHRERSVRWHAAYERRGGLA